MSKYRIVHRSGRIKAMYFAQKKWLGLVWGDLPWLSTGGYGKWPEGGENPSTQLHLVENYIEMYRDGFGEGDRVIKEFD